MDSIITKISEDFDFEMPKSEKMNWEAILAISKNLREFSEINYYKFAKISLSIKRTKQRIINQYESRFV